MTRGREWHDRPRTDFEADRETATPLDLAATSTIPALDLTSAQSSHRGRRSRHRCIRTYRVPASLMIVGALIDRGQSIRTTMAARSHRVDALRECCQV